MLDTYMALRNKLVALENERERIQQQVSMYEGKLLLAYMQEQVKPIYEALDKLGALEDVSITPSTVATCFEAVVKQVSYSVDCALENLNTWAPPEPSEAAGTEQDVVSTEPDDVAEVAVDAEPVEEKQQPDAEVAAEVAVREDTNESVDARMASILDECMLEYKSVHRKLSGDAVVDVDENKCVVTITKVGFTGNERKWLYSRVQEYFGKDWTIA